MTNFVQDIELPLLNGESVDTAGTQLQTVDRYTGALDLFTVEIPDDTGALVERPTYAVAENELLRQMQTDDQIKVLGVSNDFEHGFTADVEMHSLAMQVVYAKEDILMIHRLNESGRLRSRDLSEGSLDGYEDLFVEVESAVLPF
jgi:hypothetical protein